LPNQPSGPAPRHLLKCQYGDSYSTDSSHTSRRAGTGTARTSSRWTAKRRRGVALADAALETVEDGSLGHVVELLLEDCSLDPGAGEDGDDRDESDAPASLGVDFLVVEQCRGDERAEEVERGAGADSEVGFQPGRHEAIVEVADEEGWE
jgi:hypothetical protein